MQNNIDANIICVGQSGNGISTLCNFLLKDEVFSTGYEFSQETTSIDMREMIHSYNGNDYNLNIVDTPVYGITEDNECFKLLKKFVLPL